MNIVLSFCFVFKERHCYFCGNTLDNRARRDIFGYDATARNNGLLANDNAWKYCNSSADDNIVFDNWRGEQNTLWISVVKKTGVRGYENVVPHFASIPDC